jgi:hypothetical protein
MRWWLVIFLVFTSMAAAHIYREDPPRVIAFRNRLGLSPSKCIRHGLVEKINGKRKPRTCKALGQISVDYSRAHHAPALITSPGEVSEQARVFLHFSSPSHLLHQDSAATSPSRPTLSSRPRPFVDSNLGSFIEFTPLKRCPWSGLDGTMSIATLLHLRSSPYAYATRPTLRRSPVSA